MRQSSDRKSSQRIGALAGVLSVGLLLGAVGATHADDLSIHGKTYVDTTYKSNKDEGTGEKSSDSGWGTDLKRFYVTVDYKYDDVWSANFTSDIGDKGTKRYDLFVKKAYIQAKLSDAVAFRVGSADTPWIPFVEGLYGYRYLENTLIDRLKFGNSADWGVHFLGKSGVVSYAAGVINGRGYSDPSRSKQPDITARVAFEPVKDLTIGVGAYSGKLGQDTDASPADHTATRYDIAVAYNGSFRLGGEYFSADNWNNVTSAVKDSADGFSGWFSVPVGAKAEVFARYDTANTSKDLNPDLEDTYYNAGVQIHPIDPLLVSFAYKHEEVDSGLGGKINGVGSSLPNEKGKSDEFGVWAQFKW